jgi:SPP1 family predicted phage head-tail adaptor
MTYIIKKPKNTVVCAGDLNKKILISVRNIVTPQDGAVDYSEALSEKRAVWAMVETVTGASIFDGTNIVPEFTHRFTIRWQKDLTIQNRIEFQGQVYRIIKVENQNQLNRFWVISCKLIGDQDLLNNQT